LDIQTINPLFCKRIFSPGRLRQGKEVHIAFNHTEYSELQFYPWKIAVYNDKNSNILAFLGKFPNQMGTLDYAESEVMDGRPLNG
jgi:hypothetical protein